MVTLRNALSACHFLSVDTDACTNGVRMTRRHIAFKLFKIFLSRIVRILLFTDLDGLLHEQLTFTELWNGKPLRNLEGL